MKVEVGNKNRLFKITLWLFRALLMVCIIAIILALVIGIYAKSESGIISRYVLHLSFIIATFILLRFFDDGSVKGIGIFKEGKRTVVTFLIGCIMAFLSCTVIFLVVILSGEISLESVSLESMFNRLVGETLIYLLVVSIAEEVFFRGYIINCMPVIKSFAIRSIVSAVLFSLMHLVNPSYNSVVIFIYAFTLALLLSYTLRISGSIWMGIGFHFIWNMLQKLYMIPDEGKATYLITGVVIIVNFFVLLVIRDVLVKGDRI